MAFAALCYIGVTLLLFRNLLPVLTTNLPSDLGDPLLNTAILAWNAKHLPLTPDWWNFPAFAPLSGVTAFTEHLLGAYPLSSPIIWETGNAVLAYNVLLLACFPLNGLATYALVRELTGSAPGALVGGFAFAFAPFISNQLAHVQMLTAFGMPFALFALHRYMNGGRRRDLAWFGIAWLEVLLSNAYFLVFFPILVALWMAWFFRRTALRRWVAVAATAAAATLPIVPLLIGYYTRQTAYGFAREYPEVLAFSAGVHSLAGVSHFSVLWKQWLPTTYGEASLFPGFDHYSACDCRGRVQHPVGRASIVAAGGAVLSRGCGPDVGVRPGTVGAVVGRARTAALRPLLVVAAPPRLAQHSRSSTRVACRDVMSGRLRRVWRSRTGVARADAAADAAVGGADRGRRMVRR